MTRRFPKLTPEYVREKHLTDGWTWKRIADEVGCTKEAVWSFAKRHGIEFKKRDPYIGKRFGMLVVISHAGHRRKNPIYNCKCDCGNDKIVLGYCLKGGSTTSCGCKNKRKGPSRPNFTGYEGVSGTLWGRIHQNATARDIPIEIGPKEAYEQFVWQEGICAYTGRTLTFPKDSTDSRHGGGTASLDRRDNDKGYEPSNIQWVHKAVNCMKNAHSEAVFLGLIKEIYEYRRLDMLNPSVTDSLAA